MFRERRLFNIYYIFNVFRERKRERERDAKVVYIYIYIYMKILESLCGEVEF